jgi:2Fe-2S ferredoxin
MPYINFILHDGSAVQLEAAEGDPVATVATNNGLSGIVSACGGFCSCATCHVYVDPSWYSQLPAPSDDESALLEGTAAERLPTSRLSCQIKMTEELDGLTVRLPERQE